MKLYIFPIVNNYKQSKLGGFWEMKKIRKNSMYLLFFSLILLLAACTNEPTPENKIYIAKVSDFEDNVFTNTQSQSIGLFDEGLRIAGPQQKTTKRKTSLDKIISSISGGTDGHIVKVFPKAKIKTEDDKYYITAEGIELVFTKVGERIIKDEEGIEYTTSKYSD